jgi:hypothetical protein
MSISIIIGMIIAAIIIVAIEILLVMVIWNHIIVKKFPNSNIQPLTYWESFAIIILCHIYLEWERR